MSQNCLHKTGSLSHARGTLYSQGHTPRPSHFTSIWHHFTTLHLHSLGRLAAQVPKVCTAGVFLRALFFACAAWPLCEIHWVPCCIAVTVAGSRGHRCTSVQHSTSAVFVYGDSQSENLVDFKEIYVKIKWKLVFFSLFSSST